MGKHIYVDNSNVWIEGKYHSAVHKGIIGDVDDAHANKLCDMQWRYDFGKLLLTVAGDVASIKKAVLFGSKPPYNDSLWNTAESVGFEVKTLDRNAGGKEKGVDTGFVVRIMTDLYGKNIEDDDEFVIVAGDADYIPVVEAIKSRNLKVMIAFWNNIANGLKEKADEFVDLNLHMDEISYITTEYK